MSKLITPFLDQYESIMQFSFGSEDMYLFHCAGHGAGDFGRNQSESQFCQTVKRLFKKFSPGKNETPPRLLRQSFITVRRESHCAQHVAPMVSCH